MTTNHEEESAMSTKTADKPFAVRTLDGGLRSLHPTLTAAYDVAVQANAAAEKLGIQARYEVREETPADA